jgi:hypothetical protein
MLRHVSKPGRNNWTIGKTKIKGIPQKLFIWNQMQKKNGFNYLKKT